MRIPPISCPFQAGRLNNQSSSSARVCAMCTKSTKPVDAVQETVDVQRGSRSKHLFYSKHQSSLINLLRCAKFHIHNFTNKSSNFTVLVEEMELTF